MVFDISHITEYTYSSDVFFEPHYFRFKPKITPHLAIKEFSIVIEPEPLGLSEQIDIENNHILLCWFENTYPCLKITAKCVVQLNEFNPFNFLVYPTEYLHLPFQYDKHQRQLLKPSLRTSPLSRPLNNFMEGILSVSNNQTISFLTNLTERIHHEFTLYTRETGNSHNPDYTFKKKKGSCRDLAWMQIHMLRQLGIASRFVSGYYYLDVENPEFELHAWVEAYLPGAGWIGLDPGHGILTSSYHIPVASSAYYQNTMPVSGSVRGNAKSTLKNLLTILLDPKQ